MLVEIDLAWCVFNPPALNELIDPVNSFDERSGKWLDPDAQDVVDRFGGKRYAEVACTSTTELLDLPAYYMTYASRVYYAAAFLRCLLAEHLPKNDVQGIIGNLESIMTEVKELVYKPEDKLQHWTPAQLEALLHALELVEAWVADFAYAAYGPGFELEGIPQLARRLQDLVDHAAPANRGDVT